MEERIVAAPGSGVWRIGRGDDPLKLPEREPLFLGDTDTRAGNRFDSVTGRFAVLYFSTTLDGCFGETLSRLRPDPKLAFVRDEWETRDFMRAGSVPADWRSRRTAVRVQIDDDQDFFNVENVENHRLIERELGPTLSMLGYADVDTALIRGRDRRVTRLISEWAWDQGDEDGYPVFAGIRYLSRSNPEWECWAVYDDAELSELERQPLLLDTPGLKTVAEHFGLQPF